MTTGLPEGYDKDFELYRRPGTVKRYRRGTAGEGIEYLLRHSYGPLLIDATKAALAETGATRARIVEFGCGAGMAIQHLTEQLHEEGVDVELAVGADFAPEMVAAATADVRESASPWAAERLRFVVASSEHLVGRLTEALDEPMAGTFQIAFGVNTFRYPIRHGTADETVGQLRTLLAPGGRLVVIDMNDRFPYALKPKFRSSSRLPSFGSEPLPSLAGYARPIRDGGFQIVRAAKFVWIPHSATGIRFRVARAASGVLNRLFPDRAMRSLVVARKP